MVADVFVRPYRPAHHAQVRWLHDRTPPAGQVAARPQPWPKSLDRIEENFVAFWVAMEQGEGGDECLVGMCGLEAVAGPGANETAGVPLPDFLRSDSRTARLEAMRVAPERQRRGIGRLLTQTALDWARDTGYERIVLDTTPQQEAAIALYRAMGFEVAGRSTFDRFEIVWLEQHLSKTPAAPGAAAG